MHRAVDRVNENAIVAKYAVAFLYRLDAKTLTNDVTAKLQSSNEYFKLLIQTCAAKPSPFGNTRSLHASGIEALRGVRIAASNIDTTVKGMELASLFGAISSVTLFKGRLSIATQKIDEQLAHLRARGASARRFVGAERRRLLRRICGAADTDANARPFADPELNRVLAVAPAVHLQSVSEALLERLGDKSSSEIVKALVAKQERPVALNKLCDDGADKQLLAGIVSKDGTRLLKARRYCCNSLECMKKMHVKLHGFGDLLALRSQRPLLRGRKPSKPSTALDAAAAATENIDVAFKVHLPLLGAVAACALRRFRSRAVAVDIATAASKELFLFSPYFNIRYRGIVSAASAIVELHLRRERGLFSESSALWTAKRVVSRDAIAATMGFWHLYFEPCIETLRLGSTIDSEALIRKVDAKYTAFENEKGNANVDAALLCRKLHFDVARRAEPTDAAQLRFLCQYPVANGEPVVAPTLPTDVFGASRNLEHFAANVKDSLANANAAALGLSSADNCLVFIDGVSSQSFDELASNLRRAAPSLGCSELGTLQDKAEDVRAHTWPIDGLHVAALASAAARRLEAVVPNAWTAVFGDTVSPQVVERELRCHPAAALLTQLNGSDYAAPEVVEDTPPVQACRAPFATAPRAPIGTAADADPVQLRIDMEAALSTLLHGERKDEVPLVGSVVVSKPAFVDVNHAADFLANGREVINQDEVRLFRRRPVMRHRPMVSVLIGMINSSFLTSLFDAADTMALKAMALSLQNTMPMHADPTTQTVPQDCVVLSTARTLFADDVHMRRAFQVHERRLDRAVELEVRKRFPSFDIATAKSSFSGVGELSARENDAVNYYMSGEAQNAVVLWGALATPTNSQDKVNALLGDDNINAWKLANGASKAWELCSLLAGRPCLYASSPVPNLAFTQEAVELRDVRLAGDTPDTSEIARILVAIDAFDRSRNSLKARVVGHGVVLSQVRHAGVDDGPAWREFDDLVWRLRRATETLQEDRSEVSFVAVRAVERSAATLDGLNDQERRARLDAMREAEAKKAKLSDAFADLSPNEHGRLQAISASLGFVLTARELFGFDGMAAHLLGVVEPEPDAPTPPTPQALFARAYASILRTRPEDLSAQQQCACDGLLAELKGAVAKLNTGKATLATTNDFYRHALVVEFLCRFAEHYGSPREAKAAIKIRRYGYCFLSCQVNAHRRASTPPTAAAAPDAFDLDDADMCEDAEEPAQAENGTDAAEEERLAAPRSELSRADLRTLAIGR
jgi:hypothetical protein